MRRFNVHFLALLLLVPFLSSQADRPDSDEGYLGIVFIRSHDPNLIQVDYVADSSSASLAGIKKGDYILAINGISTQGMNILQALHAVEGKIGTSVNLTIRDGNSLEKELFVVRQSLLDAYSLSAEKGDSRAEFCLGYFYEHGPIPSRNLAKAAEWYHKAADHGSVSAQINLGYMFQNGLGVTKDQKAAVSWYLKAAKQGSAPAQRELAFCYLKGEGIRQSDLDAFNWFYSAAKQDDSTAEEYLGLLYWQGRGVVKNDQKAFDWYYRSAQQNNVYAQWQLAYMYEAGLGVKKNAGEALEWYRKAQVGLPNNKDLKKTLAIMDLKAFFETPNSASQFDPSLLIDVFRWHILFLFLFLMAIYLFGGLLLLKSTFIALNTPLKLYTAIGWVGFYIESQGVAMLVLCILVKSITASAVIIAISIFGALPVIASSWGSSRSRIWKPSEVSRGRFLLYGASSILIMLIMHFGYEKVYEWITHLPLPLQPTQMLISKAKQASTWLAYLNIALVLPVAEEIIFRSYLYDALRRYFSEKIVVIITALAFSLIHFQWHYFMPLFGAGLVLGWVKSKTNSIHLPILVHSINNGFLLASTV